jgi:hypothetical protein
MDPRSREKLVIARLISGIRAASQDRVTRMGSDRQIYETTAWDDLFHLIREVEQDHLPMSDEGRLLDDLSQACLQRADGYLSDELEDKIVRLAAEARDLLSKQKRHGDRLSQAVIDLARMYQPCSECDRPAIVRWFDEEWDPHLRCDEHGPYYGSDSHNSRPPRVFLYPPRIANILLFAQET